MNIRDSVLLRWLWLLVTFFKYKYKYRKNVHFSGVSYLYAASGSIIEFLGEGTWINNYSVSNMFGLYQRTIFYATNGGCITIGSGCGISGTSFCAMNRIKIGDRVQIGANTKIIDNDMHSLNAHDRSLDIRATIKSSPVIIGDDSFIGANCIILKGTTLGKKTIVGAGSVVHGTFPDNVIIAGNPARIVKSNK